MSHCGSKICVFLATYPHESYVNITKFSQPQLNEIIQENVELTEQVRHYLKKTNEILKQEHAKTRTS